MQWACIAEALVFWRPRAMNDIFKRRALWRIRDNPEL
jgi:hypothetical protein